MTPLDHGYRTSKSTVLCLLFGCASDTASLSGGDRYCGEVWTQWSRSGKNVRLVTTTFTKRTFGIFRYDIPACSITEHEITIGKTRAGYILRLFRALRKIMPERSDVTFSASGYFFDFLPALLLKLRRRTRKVVVPIFHLIPPPWARGGNVLVNGFAWLENRFMIGLIRHFADLVIVDNPELHEQLCRLGIHSRKLYLTAMGVTRPNPVPADSPKRYDAVYVGRLMRQKGVDALITIWKDVVAHFPSARLALIGAADSALALPDLIRSNGLEANIEIHSGLSDEDVWKRLRESRIFVTASREEGYGLSVLEALAAGLPCVTFDLSAFQFAFPAGRVSVKPFNNTQFADRVCDLLEQPERSKLLVEQAASHYRFKSWETVSEELWNAISA